MINIKLKSSHEQFLQDVIMMSKDKTKVNAHTNAFTTWNI